MRKAVVSGCIVGMVLLSACAHQPDYGDPERQRELDARLELSRAKRDEQKKQLEEYEARIKRMNEERDKQSEADYERARKIDAASEAGAEQDADNQIAEMIKRNPSWKSFERAARNREAVIGMPEGLFSAVRLSWNCEANVTEGKDRHRTQYVCHGAFSKSRKLQGRYFYVEGPVEMHQGEKVFRGKLTAIQNQ